MLWNVVQSQIDFCEFLKYRYLVDVDGICSAWIALFRKLASKSVVIKIQSEYQQWYYNRLQPWIHYVPLRPDAEDIESVYSWLQNHQAECKNIVANANALISKIQYGDEIFNTANLLKKIFECKKS